MKVGIFTADSNGGYPVPASKGGAVSTLIESLVKGNNSKKLFNMEIISLHDELAVDLSKKYPNISFKWIKIPFIIKICDDAFFYFFNVLNKQKKSSSFRSIFSLAFYIIKSSFILRNNIYDKVILENNIPLAWIIKLSNYNRDFYYHLHNVPRINAGIKDVFSKCKAYLCVSKFVGTEISSNKNPIGPIPNEKIRVLYNCIDINKFHFDYDKRIFIRRKYSIDDDCLMVIFVGRMSREKGVDVLLKALKLVRRKYKVLIIGSYLHGSNIKDHFQNELVTMVESIKDNVIFAGFVNNDELYSYYSAADIAVLPSMWEEPAGLTMIEAAACGLRVVTTDSGGIPEYMDGNAIILKRNDETIIEIAKEITKAKIQSGFHEVLSKSDRIRDTYNEDNYIQNFYQAIKD